MHICQTLVPQALREEQEAEEREAAERAAGMGKFKPEDYIDLSDLSLSADLDEEQMLDVLGVRFGADRIYTFTGPVLLAANPFRACANLYTEERLRS